MPDSDKIPVAVYQVDHSQFGDDEFQEIVDTIVRKINSKGEGYKEEQIPGGSFNGYNVRLFSSFKKYPPRWNKFLTPVLEKKSRLVKCENKTWSFICLISYEKDVFAITGGFGSFAIERFTSENFGLEILVRLFEKNSKVIKSIQDRGVTGVVLGQTKFYRGDQRFSDENQFGKIFKNVRAELNKKILTKTFGFSEADLQRTVSGCLAKSSFQINKSIDFRFLLLLVKRFSEILKLKENFSLNKVTVISRRHPQNAALLSQLKDKLLEKLYSDCKNEIAPDVDFCNKDFENYLTASFFTVVLDKDDKIEFHSPPGLMEVIGEMRKKGRYLDEDKYHFKASVLDRIITTTDENNILLTGGTVFEHLHGELTLGDKTYFFVDGEWYEIHPDFITDLNKECSEILTEIWDDKLISETFDVRKRESMFNLQFIGKEGWLVFDRITPDLIEACDILHYDHNAVHLIHVKKGFDNSVRDLASQIIISAKRIREDIKSGFNYIEQVELQTKQGISSASADMKKMAGQSFPPGGIKELFINRRHNNIVFCLAFVDTASENRVLKNAVHNFQSNIAKYSLVELRREIISMGFSFKVIQLNKR